MLIKIDQSSLFTKEPAKRFAKRFNVPESLWIELWLRYKIKDYTIAELQEYAHIKVGWRPRYIVIWRWIVRTEIYSLSREAVKKGATTVVSSFFGEFEQDVINEVTKHMKGGDKKSTRSMV